MYIHICGRKTWLAQRRITSAFKLGRECYLNNSFRSVDPQRSLPMYRNVYVCGPLYVCVRTPESQYTCVRVCVRTHKINNKLCHLNLLITSRQAGRVKLSY